MASQDKFIKVKGKQLKLDEPSSAMRSDARLRDIIA
jgi:hypothetical protein